MIERDGVNLQDIEAKERYEAARLRLASELGDRVRALVPLEQQAVVPADGNYQQRAAVIEAGLELIVPLRRFIETELRAWVDQELLDRRVIETDDIMVDVYIKAVEQAGTAPMARAFYTWLRRIARREVRKAILAVDQQAARELSVNRPVTPEDEEWPDDVYQLFETLVDPNAELPAELLERRELREAIMPHLARLPEQWREIFLLSTVDGWTTNEIADLEGLDTTGTEHRIAVARQLLRSWMEEAMLYRELED